MASWLKGASHEVADSARDLFARSRNYTRSKGIHERQGLLAVGPWICFVVTVVQFIAAYHRTPRIVLIPLMVGFAFGALRAKRAKDMQDRNQFEVTMLCLMALLLGAAVGLAVYEEYFGYYWYVSDGYSYANIFPSENAMSYSDAGMIIFADEARLDSSRAMGFKDTHTYCVAPIMDDTRGATPVQFWAAGVDCCGARGNFICDDASDPIAHAGMVIQNISGFQHDWHHQYLQAVAQAEAAYGITSSAEPLFVRWLVDPAQLQLINWRFGIGIVIVACAAYLAFSCGLAWLLLHRNRIRAELGSRGLRLPSSYY